jgi:bifunctional DNA-binding transcriptional regulator/antitoxin component of YhaV-PrlF toxin-antitoxin module
MGYQSKITAKGQTTLPIEVREHLKVGPGDRVTYLIDEAGVRIVAKSRRAVDLAGVLGPPPNGPATLEEIDEGIGWAIAEEDARIKRQWNELRKKRG